MPLKHFISTEDLSCDQYTCICRAARGFQEAVEAGRTLTHLCSGKVLATAFFQESARTAAALQSAITRLGGGHVWISSTEAARLATEPDEMLDALRSIAALSDVMAVRHKDLDLRAIAPHFDVPLINAMCGRHEHSLVALGLVYSLYRRFRDLRSVEIGIYGMTAYSRPAKAVIKAMSLFGGTIYEDAVIDQLKAPSDIADFVQHSGARLIKARLGDFISRVDMLMVTEGHPQPEADAAFLEEYHRSIHSVTRADLAALKPGAVMTYIMPRTLPDGRLTVERDVDEHPQVINRLRMREWVYAIMALINHLLDVTG